ncbi:putative J domain-containing protein [Psilocybe cubensis]|uniref:J domain-containing protein n=2 Tax=Psilocybe cubensis TaxID=181762 RepID=A0A8H8CND1_PSICU|nr:putative J domain-containing protein [Psilocybe cubensis]KAH9484290.1 putative J domain-containing protein [Psilocybe cubensis]
MGKRLSDLCLSFLDQTNFTVTSLTACFILYSRSTGVIYFTAGAVCCSLSVKVVKRLIRQPRPAHNPGRKMKVTYGMPSTHSATISFFATYILLACMYLPIHPSLHPEHAFRVFPPLVCLPWAATIVMSRVWLGHHTWPQVIAGASYGVTFSLMWFAMWVGGLNDSEGTRAIEKLVSSVCQSQTHTPTIMDDNDPINQFFPGEEEVDLYAVLSLEKDATIEAIKKAYRRLALVYHPDKHASATEEAKENASKRFQQIGFAYAVLSDNKRKARYDSSGRTDEGFELGAGDDGWEAYFEELFDRVTRGKLDEMKKEYQGSAEEMEDLKAAYETTEGSLGELMTYIPHSTHEDEERFIVAITELIKKGELKSTATWRSTSKDEKAKMVRKKESEKEAKEAEALAKELGVWDEFYGSGKATERKKAKNKAKEKDGDEEAHEDHSTLQALILKKKQKNMDGFFDSLAAKYSEPAPKASRSKGKKRSHDVAEDDDSPKKKSRSNVPPPQEIDDAEFARLQDKLFGDKDKAKASSSSPKKKGKGRKAK